MVQHKLGGTGLWEALRGDRTSHKWLANSIRTWGAALESRAMASSVRTGMSWKRFLREVGREIKAAERSSRRSAVERHRELARQAREREKAQLERERTARAQYQRSRREEQEAAKEAERQRAADEVEMFESYLEVLTSVHKEVLLDTDWVAEASAAPPESPSPATTHEAKARAALKAFTPGFLARLSGSARRTREQLERAVGEAKAADATLHQVAMAGHRTEMACHAARVELAHGVLKRDPAWYRRAMEALLGIEDLVELGVEVTAEEVEPDAIALSCAVRDDEIVPQEEVKLSAGGKLSAKKWAESRYWGLYQDFVCGIAIRLAREALGLLPISRVVINVSTRMLSTSTGHVETVTILAAHFTRAALAAINAAAVDASDALAHFDCRMKFKKTSGFERVDAITLADSWVQ